MALRVWAVYELTDYASVWYLNNAASSIVKKTHPLKNNLAEKMNEF